MLNIERLDHIAITSENPERSIAFYKEILGMKPALEWPGDITMLQAGDTYIAIAWRNKGKKDKKQPPITVDHFAFRVDKDSYNFAKKELSKHKIEIIEETDHGNSQGLYFRDPDGHQIELICYEMKGKESKMPRIL